MTVQRPFWPIDTCYNVMALTQPRVWLNHDTFTAPGSSFCSQLPLLINCAVYECLVLSAVVPDTFAYSRTVTDWLPLLAKVMALGEENECQLGIQQAMGMTWWITRVVLFAEMRTEQAGTLSTRSAPEFLGHRRAASQIAPYFLDSALTWSKVVHCSKLNSDIGLITEQISSLIHLITIWLQQGISLK